MTTYALSGAPGIAGLVTADKITDAGNTQLLIAAAVGIAVVVLTITWAKLHPFLGLMLGTAALGVVASVGPEDILNSFVKGFGSTMGAVGLLIALGAMVGKLLTDSGGAEQIVDRIVGNVSANKLPWAMALIAAILGIPLFFEIGVVLLIPIVLMVARKFDISLMKVGIPALAGLSVLHGFIPPHPGPLAAIANLNADVGLVLMYGLIVAIPTLVISGPLLARVIDPIVHVKAPIAPGVGGSEASVEIQMPDAPQLPRKASFGAALFCILLPVVLMLARAITELTLDENNGLRTFFTWIGEPTVALLLAVLAGMILLGYRSGMNRNQVEKTVGGALPAIAGIMLIVAAGGGFKQMLVDAGVGNVIGDMAKNAGISALVLGWLVAVGIRLATGSATVATITAAGIVAPLASDMGSNQLALLVLAIGAGSLFFSHVNDAGFWLVKEYFGLTVGQTIKSWSVMETVISVVGLICVLLLNLVV
ncbi:Gluconate permease [Nostocoides japonicum T1-X7]|uniref:Gluconate permease n=1 Tax=Nostocoides japonicum T1-X7 TaxID=1194083 RepID=A0A077LVC9_9MICO|nr:gluconate:H+ symporter [Tetrasphaera japonica]CCH76732.1 Gluconate permease [Tetrasphaera japonica T1-X7]